MEFYDIGVNLTDPVFRGQYRGKTLHEDDMELMFDRAREAGVTRMMVTCARKEDLAPAEQLCREHRGLTMTVGIHPTQSGQLLKDKKLIGRLRETAERLKKEGICVAYGETGLDYARLHFADRETQLKGFREQLKLAQELDLPLFLHCRDATDDFMELIDEAKRRGPLRGVVHSFTSSLDDLQRVLDAGFDVSLNGASLRDNIQLASAIPLNRLQLETDAPWCDIRPTHPAWSHLKSPPKTVKVERYRCERDTQVRGRNEPANITLVAEAVASLRGCTVEEVAAAALNNSLKMFTGHPLQN